MMGKEQVKDLNKFLKPFPDAVKETTHWLREFIWDAYPNCNELIYDNYNALAVGFAPSNKAGDIFVSFAVYSSYVNLGFNRGSEIPDPKNLLKGNGSLYRHVRVDRESFPSVYITKLMKRAYQNALIRLKEKSDDHGLTVIKSISPVQRRPKKKFMTFEISNISIKINDVDTVSAEIFIPALAKAIFVFAHGAGAGMNHLFMNELSAELANQQIATLRYNFLFMEQKKGRPDFPAVAHKVVTAAINKAIELFPSFPIFAGGKSFGGRMTSQLLASQQITQVKGLIFVGFPLHPAGKPSIDRAAHLQEIAIPMLFLQGTKDALAELHLIEGVCASLPNATLVKLDGADHAFKMSKQKAIPILAEHINTWIDRING